MCCPQFIVHLAPLCGLPRSLLVQLQIRRCNIRSAARLCANTDGSGNKFKTVNVPIKLLLHMLDSKVKIWFLSLKNAAKSGKRWPFRYSVCTKIMAIQCLSKCKKNCLVSARTFVRVCMMQFLESLKHWLSDIKAWKINLRPTDSRPSV